MRRNYRIQDSKLILFGYFLCDLILRDIEEFEKYGVAASDVTNFRSLCDTFTKFPVDRQTYLNYIVAIEERDRIIKELQEIVKSMATRVELKWGKKSPKYRSLGIGDLSKMTIESYATRIRIIHSFLNENISELVTEGLTQLMLDNFETKILALDSAINKTVDKDSLRQEKTKERITKGNEIYRLVTKYCEIGKRSWENVNPAKYNDYLIYHGNRK